METVLSLSVGGFPPLSARGCVQRLWTVNEGTFRRTITGELVYLGGGYKKYRTCIEGEDQAVFATDGLFQPGVRITVGCLQRLWKSVDKDSVTLDRLAVEGSVMGMDANRRSVKPISVKGQEALFPEGFAGPYVMYRPQLSMFVVRYELLTQEWEMKCRWVLELEEV